MFRDIEKLLILAEAYSTRKGITLSSVATYAAGQGALFRRLKNGCSITVARKDKIIQWFSDNWPSDLDWPADIPRPVTKKEKEHA